MMDPISSETKRAPRRNRRLMAYALLHKKALGLGLFILLIATLFDLLGPYIIRYILDHKISDNGALWDWHSLLLLLLAYLLAMLCGGVGRYAGNVFMQKASNGVVFSMRNDLYAHIQKLSIAFFDSQAAGTIVSRITNDTEAVRQLYVNVLSTFATSFFYIISISVIMISMKPVLALAAAAVIPMLFGFIWLYGHLSSDLLHKYRKKRSQLNALLNESISGMTILTTFRRQKETMEEFEEINQSYFRYLNQLMKVEASLSFNITSFLREICFAMLILLFGRQVLGGQSLATAGVLYLFIDYITKIFGQAQNIMNRLSNMQRAVVAADHIFHLLDEPQEEENTAPSSPEQEAKTSLNLPHQTAFRTDFTASKDPGEAASQELLQDRQSPLPSSGKPKKSTGAEVVFQDVTFAYKEENWVLQNISLHAKAGETTAFVGHTGSGKSSMMNLLLRFYDPQKGRILINGKEISSMSRSALRSGMAIVLQDPFLFTGTLSSNITLDNPAISAQQAQEALLAVGGENLLHSLPKGMEEPVLEKGSTLSSGQRQLISFARALAYDPDILILDEATASIDSETEELIQKAMDVVQRGRTTFIIAHRLSTIRNAHQILVLDQGRIAEQGTHDELIALHGRYYQMYLLQSQSPLE